MKDIFAIHSIQINAEFGKAFKNFRIEQGVTATAIIKRFNKNPTYITKFEKGEIKKINTDFFIELCNYITASTDGVKLFLSRMAHFYNTMSTETKTILMNIDEAIVSHTLPSKLVTDILEYMDGHDISKSELFRKINANEDVLDYPSFASAPPNIWYSDLENDQTFIKLDIPYDFINDFLEFRIDKIHYVTALAILYALYRLGNEEDPYAVSFSKLRIYQISKYLQEDNSSNSKDPLFENLQPDDVESLREIISSLKLVINLTKDDNYGTGKIKQIQANLESDLGFSFAFMSLDLEKIILQNKERKQEFLNDLKQLIDKYSESNLGLDRYE